MRESCERVGGVHIRTMNIVAVDKEDIVLSLAQETWNRSRCLCLFAIKLMGLEDRVCFCDSQAI